MIATSSRVALPLRFLLGVVLAVLVGLALFFAVMNPPLREMRAMGWFLSITALISVVAGYLLYRLGWIDRTPRLSWMLAGSYALASALTFLNVYVTARLMFASQHDLQLATVLLIFAGGIAMALGYFFSSALTDRIQALNRAAHSIAAGELDVQVPVQGRNEMAQLAATFNGMASQLAQAARSQREAEQLRQELLAWVGHDLRTPLSSIRAIVEALADGLVTDAATQRRYLLTAQRDIQSLSALIDDLFEMSQIGAGGLQLDRHFASLTDLLSDTLESFTALATAKGVSLTGQAGAGVDPVAMDVQKIGRVLGNLIGNAIRHTPPGGLVRVQAMPVGRNVLVEVIDSGEGIPAASLGRVFDQFYRAEESRNRETGGAGLGLAIAKGIVAAHGGEIGVQSEAGAGARFWFVLPRG
ncbi:MAG: HAMP domain-containing histidine kinase [Chloroflexi bacterium]|nr:HAMP domain-containing histidine kinase [Chloroflexota bacterium]